ncbi:MAG TPA: PepSY-associated TM helix domain-containing protein [Allosphingosinicella sp.]|uniref:PepSY-associated TM helix domain-containing protein n=1 Tax=Allosphingosinicella sp. TaxID=2823234 RepID=UPI002EDAD2B7
MRPTLFRVHLWLGFIVGLLWALQGLTGAMLVFHRDIDRWVRPPVEAGPMVPVGRIVAVAEARTGRPVQMVAIADGHGDLLNVHYADDAGPKLLQSEASTGRVVGAGDYDPATPFAGSGWRWLYLLHESLLLHDRGETLIGLSGILLLTALGTGLWIGWPKWRQWRFALDWRRWRSVRARLFGWHRLSGLVVGTILFITVPGGVWMIFAAELRSAVAGVVPHQLPYKAQPVPKLVSVVAPDAVLQTARATFPNADFVRLTMPTPKAPVYTVRLRQPDETRVWSGVTSVTLDAQTGRTLDVYDPTRAPLSNRLADAAFSVHSGELAGLPGRILLMLAGLALPALYVTGIWAWWRKRRRS